MLSSWKWVQGCLQLSHQASGAAPVAVPHCHQHQVSLPAWWSNMPHQPWQQQQQQQGLQPTSTAATVQVPGLPKSQLQSMHAMAHQMPPLSVGQSPSPHRSQTAVHTWISTRSQLMKRPLRVWRRRCWGA